MAGDVGGPTEWDDPNSRDWNASGGPAWSGSGSDWSDSGQAGWDGQSEPPPTRHEGEWVETIGAPSTGNASGKSKVLLMAAAGLGSGVMAWMVVQNTERPINNWSSTTLTNNVTFSLIMVTVMGVGIALADAAWSGGIRRLGPVALVAVPAALVVGMVAGLLSHLFYDNVLNWMHEDLDPASFDLLIHPVRGVAWCVIGLGTGCVVGITSRSTSRTMGAALAGAVGGFLGGALFDFIGLEGLARLVGIALTGLLIGLAIGFFEEVRKTAWLEIVTTHGSARQFILHQPIIKIGSSPTSNVIITNDAGVPREAAVITRKGNQSLITAEPGATIYLDGQLLDSASLHDGSTISIGSVTLRFRDKATSTPMAGTYPPR